MGEAKLTMCVYCEAPTIRSTKRCDSCFGVEFLVQDNIGLVLAILDRLEIERLEWIPGPPDGRTWAVVRLASGGFKVLQPGVEMVGMNVVKSHALLREGR